MNAYTLLLACLFTSSANAASEPASSPAPAPAEAASETAPKARLHALLEANRDLKLAGTPKRVADLALSAGHFDVRLQSGSADLVLAGDEAVGLFFVGQAAMTYVSEEALDRPIMLHNVDELTDYELVETPSSLTLRERVKELLWLGDGAPTQLDGETASSLQEPFDERLEKHRQLTYPSEHLFAIRALDAPDAKLTFVELEGHEEELMYVLETIRDHDEYLSLLSERTIDTRERRDIRRSVLLSDPAYGRDPRRALPPRYQLRHADVRLEAEDKNSARLEVTQTYTARDRAHSVLDLELLSATWDVNHLGAVTERELNIESLTDGSGRPLAYHHDEDRLIVELNEPLAVGASMQLEIHITGDFLARKGENYWILGVTSWMPLPEQYNEQHYTLAVEARVRPPFEVFASGDETRREQEDGWNVIETRIDKPIMFPIIVGGKYHFETRSKHGRNVRVASYVQKNERAMKKLAKLAHQMIRAYEPFLGEFPFRDLDIIEIDQLGWGQAPPGIMFITREAFSRLGYWEKQFSRGINDRFAHEIAHQYWGHVVKMPSSEEQWLTESFAEYSAGILLKLSKQKYYKRMRDEWERRAEDSEGVASIAYANRLRGADEPHRINLLYNKGPWLLLKIHEELGDKQFLTFLKSYQRSFEWDFGNTQDVVGLIKHITKQDYSEFFDRYYWGTELPPD